MLKQLSKVMGPRGELVVSALGAMDDQHMLAPGLVTYRSSFLFNRLAEIDYTTKLTFLARMGSSTMVSTSPAQV